MFEVWFPPQRVRLRWWVRREHSGQIFSGEPSGEPSAKEKKSGDPQAEHSGKMTLATRLANCLWRNTFDQRSGMAQANLSGEKNAE